MRRERISCSLLLVLAALLLVPAAVAQVRGTISGTVTGPDGAPLSGALVLVIDVQRDTSTGRDGTYNLRVAPGTYSLLATVSGYEAAEKWVTVAADETATVDFTLARTLSQFGEELVVIGSRTARTAIETPVPVDVLSTEDIATSGQTETSRIIQFLAPSFNFSTSTISDGTDIVRPSTLRGLGPDQTLVLINGKRRHNSALVHVNGSIGRGTAGVDLNAIPAAAIERIEVLRDGAAAQYGSDAIAGVINLVLKSSPGTDVDLSAGETYEGDGETITASVNQGWVFGANNFVNVTAEYRDRGDTNRAGPDPRQQYRDPNDPREATFDRLNHRYGDAASENFGLFLNASFGLGDDAEIYVFGGASEREGESGGFYRRALDARTVPEIHPDGFLPLIETEVEDASLAVGYRQSLGSWSLDASVTGGSNSFNFFISNSNNVSLGPSSPTSADAGTLNFDQTTINVDLFGSMNWGKPVSLAFGAEYREDYYEIEAGEPASWIDGGFLDQYGEPGAPGIQVFPGFRPANEVDVSRHNVALYADLETNLTEAFLIGVAARFEDYSDFGNNLSGKLALRYAFGENFALRASTSTGFRAPSLHQSNFNNISTQFVLNDNNELVPLEVGTFRNGSAVANAFGVAPLEEETSFSYSFGFTSRPMERLSITADVFHIDIDDRIVISGQFTASNPQVAPILAPFNVNAAQFFTNAIDTETEGLDLVVAYFWPLGDKSSVSLTGAANWNETEVVGEVRTPPALAGLGETLFDRQQRVFVERGQPKEHYNLSARYTWGGFSSLIRFNKFGAVVTAESASDPSIDQTFTSKWLTDIDLAYRFQNGLTVAVGANNVFDEVPDENREEIAFNGIFPYPRRTAPFGFNGGYYYTRLTYTF